MGSARSDAKEALFDAHHAGVGLKAADSDASLNQADDIAAHSADRDLGTDRGAGRFPRLPPVSERSTTGQS